MVYVYQFLLAMLGGAIGASIYLTIHALIKVSYKGNMIPDYATEDCLERVD